MLPNLAAIVYVVLMISEITRDFQAVSLMARVDRLITAQTLNNVRIVLLDGDFS